MHFEMIRNIFFNSLCNEDFKIPMNISKIMNFTNYC